MVPQTLSPVPYRKNYIKEIKNISNSNGIGRGTLKKYKKKLMAF